MVDTNYGESSIGKWLRVRIDISISLKQGCWLVFVEGKRI